MNSKYMTNTIFDIYNPAGTIQSLTDILLSDKGFNDRVDEVIQKANNSRQAQLFTATIPFESLDPLAALEVLGDDDFQYFWEHPDEKLAISAGREVITFKTNQRDRYNIVHKHFSKWSDRSVSYCPIPHSLSGVHFLGGFSFQDQPQNHHWQSFGTAVFVVPEWIMVRDGQLSLLTISKLVQPDENPESLGDWAESTLNRILLKLSVLGESNRTNGSATSEFGDCFEQVPDPNAEFVWKSTVNEAKNRIINRDFDKIVLAREVHIKLNREPHVTHMMNFLRNEYPTCYTFMMRLNKGSVFLGCTPEKLVGLRSTLILTDGLAGTISRGKTATEDTVLERKLLKSEKDLAEHGFVVDAIGNRLRKFTHNLQFPDQPGIRKYQNVQHLYTPITANLNSDVSPLEIIERLHPTPAVGGHPREKTIQHIQSLERFDRGWYAAPMGWINTHGRGEFCVAIRSGLIGEGKARLFAGCGIVENSDPASEWEETNLKLIPMLSALKHG